jgi:hypothetical protein
MSREINWPARNSRWMRSAYIGLISGVFASSYFVNMTQGLAAGPPTIAAVVHSAPIPRVEARSSPDGQHNVDRTVSDKEMAMLRINHTTFRVPQRYVGYYDTKSHSAISMHSLLPNVTPIEPFSVGEVRKHDPRKVADVGILAIRSPNYDQFLWHMIAEGKL